MLVSNTDNRAKFVVLRHTEATGETAEAYGADRMSFNKIAAKGIIFDPAQLPINSNISQDGKLDDVLLPSADKTVLFL